MTQIPIFMNGVLKFDIAAVSIIITIGLLSSAKGFVLSASVIL